MEEHVILVDERNRPIGTCAKQHVHQGVTPLHRGFSLFLFDSANRLLLQQRSGQKQTWPLVWSNSCCGHPQKGELLESAVLRRLREELGIDEAELHVVLPDYRYQATYDGTMENEFCPVLVGWTVCSPRPNPSEVAAVRWVVWDSFIAAICDENDSTYDQFSYWCLEEARLLSQSPTFLSLRDRHVGGDAE